MRIGVLRLVVIGFFMLLAAPCLALEAKISPEANLPPDAYPQTRGLAMLFQKGQLREKVGTLDSALLAYRAVVIRAEGILNNKKSELTLVEQVLPFAIASAYRKGIVTHRLVERSVMKLNRQLELYEDAEVWINEVLTTISNLMLEQGMNIPPSQFGLLYYARAYNKAGWSFALLNGSSWKRYIVYTPSAVMLLADHQIADLRQMSMFYNVLYSDKGEVGSDVDKEIERYIEGLKTSGSEFFTLTLCSGSTDSKVVKGTLTRLLKENARKTIELYYSGSIASALNKGRGIQTFEDYQKPETREVIQAISQLLSAIGKP